MKQLISILLLWIGILSCQSEDINIYTLHAKDDSKAIDGWKMIWSEEFDQKGIQFDSNKWGFEPKGTSGWNKYLTSSTDQAYIQDGKLILRAEKKKGQYMTGGISTHNKMGFKYGKLEVCAKFNSFQGGWPAIWLLPVQRQYPNPPGKSEYGGEIDIMEQVSLQKTAWHTVHSHYTYDLGLDKNPPRSGGGSYKENEFNLYTLEWTPDELTFFINGIETFSYPNIHLENEAEMKQWPFDTPYYLILNYAVGGEGTWPGEIDDSGFPGQMEIEYVRYYQKEGEQEKPDDDEEEEEPSTNLIKNGDFEKEIAADKKPGIWAAWQTQGENTLKYLDMWFAKTGNALVVDGSTGANGSSSSLKYSANIAYSWDVDLSHPLQGVKTGKYKFSFYVKTNQDDSPFVTSITLCEDDADIAKEAKYQKTIVLQNGKQEIKTGVNDIWGTQINRAGKEWKKYSMIVNIPDNKLVKFVFKPCAGNNNSLSGYDCKKTDNAVYWFDCVTLEPTDEEGPGEGEEPATELVTNGNFEKDFAADKQPGIWATWQTQGNNTLNYLDMWFAKTNPSLNPSPTIGIDTSTGANGSTRSLKYSASNVTYSWDVDLSHPLQGVKAGKYEFSFYAKTNQTESPFTTSITLCENNEDIAKDAKYQKAIVIQNDIQTIEVGTNDIWGTVVYRVGKEWKKYSITVDIPQNVLIKFVFKPCAGTNNKLNGYDATKTDNVEYWFDDVSLKAVS